MPGIPLVCPVCSSVWPVEAGMQDADARRALAAAVALWPAPIQQQALVYLGLFAPASRRSAWPKVARLITELVDLIKSGTVTRDRDTRAAPLQLWGEGLAAVLEMRDAGKLTLPLDSHGLLCEIVHRRAGKVASQAESSIRSTHPSHRPAQPPTESREGVRDKASGLRAVGALLGRLHVATTTETTATANPDGDPA